MAQPSAPRQGLNAAQFSFYITSDINAHVSLGLRNMLSTWITFYLCQG
jgi:hypothetical protein